MTLTRKVIDNGDGTYQYADEMGSGGMETPKARHVLTMNGVTIAGAHTFIIEDLLRTGATLRNDSDTKMYFRTDGEAGDGVGYPLDPGRGYSFESFGLVPSDPISVWCATAGKRWAFMYSTDAEDDPNA